MREIAAFAKQIAKSKEERAKFEAAIHGVELNSGFDSEPMQDIPKETQEKLERRMRLLSERLKKRGKK